jgi:hypothetical protein
MEHHWIYKGEKFELTLDEALEQKLVGFIYLITHLPTGKKYVGQKKFVSTTKKAVKGSARKKIVRKMSDWQNYWSSSVILKEILATDGPERFKREILFLCKSKALMNFLETKVQLQENVLFDDNYLNNMVNIRCGGAAAKSLKQFEEICRFD